MQYAGRNYLFSTWVRMTAPNNGTGLFYIDVSAPPYIYADGLLEFVARDAELHDFMRFAIVVADVNGHYDELLNLLCAVSAFTVKDVGGNGLHLTLANFAPINTTIDGSVEWDAETMDPVAESESVQRRTTQRMHPTLTRRAARPLRLLLDLRGAVRRASSPADDAAPAARPGRDVAHRQRPRVRGQHSSHAGRHVQGAGVH